MAYASSSWKTELVEQDPMELLYTGPEDLPQFGKYPWLLTAAVMAGAEAEAVDNAQMVPV